ncbi:MAG: DNA polymerase domain-containing protein [Firmicutes bacterium]|nr:DNA polymerase domain-containing protein [Bacillota bacterium]
MTLKQLVEVEGRILELTNLDKVLWPQSGWTKADLLDYHRKMAPWTIKHWAGRPLTVTRYPHGVEQHFFFQKNSPSWAPSWLKTRLIKDIEYILPNDLSTIIWLVNLGAIEFHPASYKGCPNSPSYAVIDLDPTPPLGFQAAVEIAKHCRELLQKLGLRGYPKLSGSSGIHIYLPLASGYSFSVSSNLIKMIGMMLQKKLPYQVTLERMLKKRRGVYLDYLQNHAAKTMIGVYSPRPTSEATVSTAVDWNDLDQHCPRDFTIKTVPGWIGEHKDLFEPVQTKPQSLEHLAGQFPDV